jgi:hypothetical protein
MPTVKSGVFFTGDTRNQWLPPYPTCDIAAPLGENMASKDLMRNLSTRLEPIRDEFNRRVYDWSLAMLEEQVSSEDSLFWNVPSRVIRNLGQLFRAEPEDRLRFFLIRHACRHQIAIKQLGQLASPDQEILPLMKRCIDPSASDVLEKGLCRFPPRFLV